MNPIPIEIEYNRATQFATIQWNDLSKTFHNQPNINSIYNLVERYQCNYVEINDSPCTIL